LTPLAGRVALVTGGSRGIGRAACLGFARAGADVVVHCRERRGEAERVAAEARALGRRALVVQADVTDEAEVARMLDEVRAFAPALHVLLNNAGVYPAGSLETLTLEEWERVLAINVRGPFLVTRAALPLLRAAGGGARVINVGSVMDLRGVAGMLHYVTSKAAVAGFTRALARELAPDGITANVVVPSMVRTETSETLYPGAEDAVVAEQLVPRLQEPDDLVGLFVYLASPASEWTTGQTILAEGGRHFS
jgi:3-oxoacyl-[acyl-carrier protein] reductase